MKFTWAVEIFLKFCTLMGSFCKNHLKFQLKKYRRVISHDIEEWCKVQRKTDLWFHSNMTWRIWWIFTQPLRSLKVSLWWAIFLQSISVWATKIQRSYLSGHWVVMQKWINPDLVVSKMTWGIGSTFIRALKSLKNCTLMGSFCPKNIMFQVENFRGVMCHDTERWCKF